MPRGRHGEPPGLRARAEPRELADARAVPSAPKKVAIYGDFSVKDVDSNHEQIMEHGNSRCFQQ